VSRKAAACNRARRRRHEHRSWFTHQQRSLNALVQERANSEGRRVRRQAFVARVLEQSSVFVFDTSIARISARLWAAPATKGQIVGTHDQIIASTAISVDYAVVNGNRKDFEKIEGLRREVLDTFPGSRVHSPHCNITGEG
jgi:predicted nucleic acid-binding protein